MTREELIIALASKGYKAELAQTVKNGVVFEGIMIRNGENVAPVIYTQGIFDEAVRLGESNDEIVSNVIEIYEKNKDIGIDIEKLVSAEFILPRIFIGLQKVSEEALVKRKSQFEGIEDYLYIGESIGETNYSYKCTHDLLMRAGIDLDKAWKIATENTLRDSTINSIFDIISEMMYLEEDEEHDDFISVVSNRSRIKGASAIYNKDMLGTFARKHNTDQIVVMPSSIHEMIILPYKEDTDVLQLSDMVREINENMVAEEERLTDRVYVLTV